MFIHVQINSGVSIFMTEFISLSIIFQPVIQSSNIIWFVVVQYAHVTVYITIMVRILFHIVLRVMTFAENLKLFSIIKE